MKPQNKLITPDALYKYIAKTWKECVAKEMKKVQRETLVSTNKHLTLAK